MGKKSKNVLMGIASKEKILVSAVRVAENVGLHNLSRELVAGTAEVANTLINHHFGTMTQLKRAVVRRAIKEENLRVIAEAITLRHTCVSKIPTQLREKALRAML